MSEFDESDELDESAPGPTTSMLVDLNHMTTGEHEIEEREQVSSSLYSSADWLTDRELQDVIDFGAGGVNDISSDEVVRLIASELILLRKRVHSYLKSKQQEQGTS